MTTAQSTPQAAEEFQITVGELQPPIRVRVRREGDHLVVEQSHFLKTSIQYLPWAVREMAGESPRAAFDELRNTVLSFYEQAVRRGYPPKDNWLVPNTGYKPAKAEA